MIPPRSEDGGQDPRRAPEARLAPEPKTADQLTVERDQRRARRRAWTAAVLILLGLVASHGIAYVPKYGGWATLVLTVVGVGLSISRRGLRALASPIRGIVIVWLAISVASVVLVSLDRFSGENILLLAIVWGILLVLWLGDRGLSRFLRVPSAAHDGQDGRLGRRSGVSPGASRLVVAA